ncbi:MAG: hypothetical protein V1885_02885 [Candidatus Brennerbacteria bacterium]
MGSKESGMKKNIIITLAVLVSIAIWYAGVSAQTSLSQAFITWKASNFYPAFFKGKALPSLTSPISVAVEATKNGVLLDLSQTEILWEVDGKFIGGGRGVKQATFTATKGPGDAHFVHVSAFHGAETIETSLRIPTVQPILVIDAPYRGGRGSGGTMTLRAVPFFFNLSSLSDLSFAWTVDGMRQSVGSDTELTVSGSSNLAPRTFSVSLEAQNQRNLQEIAATRAQFSIEP